MSYLKLLFPIIISTVLATSCTSSRETDETPAEGEAAIRECIVGLWVRPSRDCECVFETPECGQEDCTQMGANFYRADGRVITGALTLTDTSVSALPMSRGDWRVEEGELSWGLGFGSTRTSFEVTCSSSDLQWGMIPLTRADPALEAVVMAHFEEDQWSGADYSRSR